LSFLLFADFNATSFHGLRSGHPEKVGFQNLGLGFREFLG
jgi:hypothetical protein